MPPGRSRRRGVALGGVLALLSAAAAGCRSPEPVLYTILPTPGAPRRGGPRTVAVREVLLARYLDRLPIVRSAEAYRLEVSGNDWWGEPLDAMLTRVLVENLAQRLPDAGVTSSAAAAASAPVEATVVVDVQRLGMAAPSALALTAQVTVDRRDARRRGATRTERVAVPVAGGGDTRAFVAAASEAVGRLADAIAAMLAG